MGITSAEIHPRTFRLVKARLRFSANGGEPRRMLPRGYTRGYISKIICDRKGGAKIN
jgi:hypothetical protein